MLITLMWMVYPVSPLALVCPVLSKVDLSATSLLHSVKFVKLVDQVTAITSHGSWLIYDLKL
jgi:hypothetical protein